MTNALLSVHGVSRQFPVGKRWPLAPQRTLKAIDDVDLELHAGETLGLVGESGCGKSTLARIVVGLDRPTSGDVRFDGQSLTKLSPAELRKLRRRFQIVFQDPYASLNPRMTVHDSIAEPLENYLHLSSDEIGQKVRALADSVGLGSHHLDRFPHELSGGQCQRVGLARAIAVGPDLIVADEPVSALDVSVQAQILNLMLEIRDRMGLAMVFVSHDLSVVAHLADRVAVMYLGRIVETGPTEQVFDDPRHPYTQMLLGSVPHPLPPDRDARVAAAGELPSPIDPPTGCHFRTRCPLADARCAGEVPTLTDVEGTHQAACHRVSEAIGLDLTEAANG